MLVCACTCTLEKSSLAINNITTTIKIAIAVYIFGKLAAVAIDATSKGAKKVPKELTPCAKVKRAGAVCGSPKIVTIGLADTCNITTPVAKTNNANKNIA